MNPWQVQTDAFLWDKRDHWQNFMFNLKVW
jgi:hypothetical protein